MKPYFYLAYFHCQVVLSFMRNILVLPFNIDIVSTLSITLVKSFQIHICQNKDLQIPNSMVYKAPDVKSTNVKYKRVLWRIFVMIIHDNFWSQTWNLVSSFPLLGFVSSDPDAPNGSLHIRLYVPVHFMYIIFSSVISSCFPNLFFHRKSLRLPCHLRYHKRFVKVPMGLKVFSLQIMYGGVTYEGQARITQAMTISPKLERSRWLKNTRLY